MSQAGCQSWGHERYSALSELCESLRDLPELQAKRAIRHAAQYTEMGNSLEEKYAQPGDDCAAIKLGDGYQLLAMEGMQSQFVASDARASGWSSVMVNISDIAAMGGRPSAIVNALWHNEDKKSQELLFHIKRACETWGIKFAGGHTSISPTTSPNLAVGILGYAKKLLSCHHVKPGQRLFLLTDLDGSWHGDLPYWACVLGKSKQRLRAQWNIPAELAEAELAVAAKDISNGGLIGTLIMMLELTQCGATIDLNAIPGPEDGDLERWLRAFQSYGFLLAVEPDKVSKLLNFFENKPLTCAPIGTINNSAEIELSALGAREVFWNVKDEPLTAMGEQYASRSV